MAPAGKSGIATKSGLGNIELDWIRLDWTGLDTDLYWIEWDWIRLDGTGLD